MDDAISARSELDLLSLVLPVYNEEEVLPLLRERLEALASELPCAVEWIFVNDGSSDRTSAMLFAWAAADERVKVLEFSRNFGHEAALLAGLDHARGAAVVTLDADLQDPPELILEMLEKYREGYDVVYGQRGKRLGEGLVKRKTAAAFYWLMRHYVHGDLPESVGNFRLMTSEVVRAVCQLREGQRFFRGMVAWLGFKQVAVVFDRPARMAGETKYPMRKMMLFALDSILSFSSSPLRVATYIGGSVILLGLFSIVYTLTRYFVYQDTVPGWSSLVVLLCFIGGAILLSLGVIGEYIGRLYEEIKNRPLYIVGRSANITPVAQIPRAVPAGPPSRTSD